MEFGSWVGSLVSKTVQRLEVGLSPYWKIVEVSLYKFSRGRLIISLKSRCGLDGLKSLKFFTSSDVSVTRQLLEFFLSNFPLNNYVLPTFLRLKYLDLCLCQSLPIYWDLWTNITSLKFYGRNNNFSCSERFPICWIIYIYPQCELPLLSLQAVLLSWRRSRWSFFRISW